MILKDKDFTLINKEIKEKTDIFESSYGITIWTISPKGERMNYMFSHTFFKEFINELEDFLSDKKNLVIRKSVIEEVFRKRISKEYRQTVALKRVVIICLNYLVLQEKVSYIDFNKIVYK